MSNQPQKDDALFDALGKSRKKKKRRIIRTAVIAVLVLAIVGAVGISFLRRQVREQFASSAGQVQSAEVSTGTISTVVSGSGTLNNVDTESVEIPAGVELDEIRVGVNDTVEKGDLLATVDLSSVQTALSELQLQLEDLDAQISEAADYEVSSYIEAGVSGRVKILYGQADMDVAHCMVENGALAMLSLDGYMAVDIETDALSAGGEVTVLRADGSEITGSVEFCADGSATILVTDNGPAYGEEVTVTSSDGSELGKGTLYIHNALAVTGYAGTISKVYVEENDKVSASTNLFYLTDTGSSAVYDALLRSRAEAEETMLELLTIQQNGGILSPIAGSVYSILDPDTDTEASELAVLSPDVSMSVTISVDESDILSLELGQEAEVTVSSVSEDALTGTVTEIDKTGGETSGTYSAVITLDKLSGMLTGMTASVDVMIEGVENAILIPVEALHQTRDGAYVYTSYDEQTQEYGGRTDVVIGLSNNNYVEIKSGLNVGDTVYYTETQSIADLFGGMGGMGGRGDFGMGGESGGMAPGGEMPDMENMPDRGQMPDRGSGGQMPEGFSGGQGG